MIALISRILAPWGLSYAALTMRRRAAKHKARLISSWLRRCKVALLFFFKMLKEVNRMKKMAEDNLVMVLACAWLIMSGAVYLIRVSMRVLVELIIELFYVSDEVNQKIWIVTGFVTLLIMGWLCIGIIICCMQ